jgi:sensor histidine kinase YesM
MIMKNISIGDFFNRRMVQHLIFWGFYLVLFIIRLVDGRGPGLVGGIENFLSREAIRTMALAIGVYFNLRVIIPNTFDKNKYYHFALSTFAMIIILAFTSMWSIELFDLDKASNLAMPYRMLWTMVHLSMFVSITSLLHFTKEWIKLKDQALTVKALRNEKLAAELESLKGQLNPHFLFNTLNNLYSLTLVKSDDAPNMILRLSDLMSYILYDSRVDFISLKKELDFSSNYINLEKLRMQEHLKMEISLNCTDEGRMIAPLLFMPLIENAFKYACTDTEKSFISISVEALENEPIRLKIQNAIIFDANQKKDHEHSGLGIQNVSKRLELIYPDKHTFKVSNKHGIFTVIMEINDL